MTITITECTNVPGKLADAEIHFGETDGLLAGLKLIGFAVWSSRYNSRLNITFPARQYSVNGERRSFSLLRPIEDSAAQELIKAAIIDAYEAHTQPTPVAVPAMTTPAPTRTPSPALDRFETAAPAPVSVTYADPKPATRRFTF